jgi:transposase
MDSKDAIITELRRVVAGLEEQIRSQAERIADLELELAKAKKDSSTSSKPPSSDIVKPSAKKKPPGKRGKRKRGGQPGHKRQLRQPLPPERVDERIDYEINEKDVQRWGLTPTDQFETIQHIELPESPIHVTEHRLRVYLSPDGEAYLPDCPQLRSQPLFGPRMLAMVGWLKSKAHCSYTTIELWMDDVLQVPVSRGYLAKLCTGVISESLAGAHEEVKQAVPLQAQLGSDETSIKNNGKKHWIWCITAATFSLFHIASSRSREVLEELVGEAYQGHLNFDYFSANCSFAWHFDIKAQYCWAHLIRDIRFLLKHPDKKTRAWAEQLLDRSRRLFTAWHRREEMTDEGFRRSMLTHRDRFLERVRNPPYTREATNLAARFAMVEYSTDRSPQLQTYDLSQDYFRFMFVAEIEPTNNHSEQQIRHCVIDRRITQGTRGELGQRYHERMWTAIATCGKQNRSFFHFLHQSIAANLSNQPAPSLLTN